MLRAGDIIVYLLRHVVLVDSVPDMAATTESLLSHPPSARRNGQTYPSLETSTLSTQLPPPL